MACELRKPEAGFIFHSDRGAQYTSHCFQQLLHERGCIQSFSNSGKPHDNAVAESFFASLKKEDLYRRDYSSEAAFKQGVASYIEFYNTVRPHRTLKNMTPCQMEESFMKGSWISWPGSWKGHGVRIESHGLDTLGFRFGKLGCLRSKFELFEILCLILLLRAEYLKALCCKAFRHKATLPNLIVSWKLFGLGRVVQFGTPDWIRTSDL